MEKHDQPGGRARQLKAGGFSFDMGPSWYWMPDVYDRYFEQFGKNRADYYQLTRLDPSYTVVWEDETLEIPASYEALRQLFERIEPGSALRLDRYLEQADFKYRTGIQKLVQKPGRSWNEFLDPDLMKGIFKLEVFSSIRKHIQRNFKNPKLRQLLEFPVLFLGALPQDTPALYSLMNFADIKGGTWYPEKGMYSIVDGMYRLARELGVQFRFGEEVTRIDTTGGKASGIQAVRTGDGTAQTYRGDVVIASADYHFVETQLLPAALRSYSDQYWESRVMAPGSLVYFVGLGKKLQKITHHTLFFDVDFETHGQEIYQSRQWPTNPLFYACASSVTDPLAAPEGQENLFFLIPVAAGLSSDREELRMKYFQQILDRFEKYAGEKISDDILYLKTYGPTDFRNDYHAFKGNAYGLANTLLQTAILKPSCKSKKVENLFYAGQLTVPGPGVPPALISGEVVAREVEKYYRA